MHVLHTTKFNLILWLFYIAGLGLGLLYYAEISHPDSDPLIDRGLVWYPSPAM